MKRNILIWLLALLLLVPVSALDRTGTVTVTMLWDETPVEGGEMTLYALGSAPFRYGGKTLSEDNAQELAQELAQDLEGRKGTTRTMDAQGRAVFEDLEPGVYLLVETQAPEGYEAASPFLVTLEAGKTVSAYPKLQLLRETEPTASPEPTISPRPTETPGVSPKPTETPVTSPAPTVTPGVSPKPTETPVTSPAPTDAPEISPNPTESPTEPTEPVPTVPVELPVSAEPTVTPSIAPSPSLSPETSPAVSTEKKTVTNPFTGDEIDLRFWTGLVSICLILLAVLLWTDKRKKNS